MKKAIGPILMVCTLETVKISNLTRKSDIEATTNDIRLNSTESKLLFSYKTKTH